MSETNELLKQKKQELDDEIKYYHELRHIPNKTPSEFQAQEKAEKTIDRLQKEIYEIENK